MDVVNMEQEEKIFSIDMMTKELADTLAVDKLFDVYRFVDIENHLVYNYNEGKMIETCQKCYTLWNRSKPCPNCSSERALQQKSKS